MCLYALAPNTCRTCFRLWNVFQTNPGFHFGGSALETHFIIWHLFFLKYMQERCYNPLSGRLTCIAAYQHVSDCLICSSWCFSAPRRVFLLKSECKAIPHWRVCLNHIEWLWILNVGLRPTVKQAYRDDSAG